MPFQSRSQSHHKLAVVALLCCALFSGVSSTPTRVTHDNLDIDSSQTSGGLERVGSGYDFAIELPVDGIGAPQKNKRDLKQFKIRRGYSGRLSRNDDTDSGDNNGGYGGNGGDDSGGYGGGYGSDNGRYGDGGDGDGDDGGYGGDYGRDHDHGHKAKKPRPSASLPYRR